jgi:hypothetical protein
MRGVLSFKLPEEQEEFKIAQKGMSLLGGAQEFDNYLRARLKYEELDEKVHEALQEARTKLHEMIEGIWE